MPFCTTPNCIIREVIQKNNNNINIINNEEVEREKNNTQNSVQARKFKETAGRRAAKTQAHFFLASMFAFLLIRIFKALLGASDPMGWNH